MLITAATEKSQIVHAGYELKTLPDPACSILCAGGYNAGNNIVRAAGSQNAVDCGYNFRCIDSMIGRSIRLKCNAHFQRKISCADKDGVQTGSSGNFFNIVKSFQ